MVDHMIQYQKKIEQLLRDSPPHTNWKQELEWFNTTFEHLQKERLIHLLVTLTVGLAALISCFAATANPITPFLVLVGILFILFFAYIIHYRKLENTAQGWYTLLDKLQQKLRE